MADQVTYELRMSNGLTLTALLENAINETSTSLVLYGRGATEYGQGLQQNLIKILESFADTLPPKFPMAGQLWYNTSTASLQVFSGTGWVTLMSSPAAALTALNAGQIPIVDSTGKIQYKTIAGDVSVDANGVSTITTTSTLSLTGDITGQVVQQGSGNVSITTDIAPAVVGIVELSNDARTEYLSGELTNVVNERRFISLRSPYTMALKSITLRTSQATTISLERSDAIGNGAELSLLSHTVIDANVMTANTIYANDLLTDWVAVDQAISIDFTGITGAVDVVNYTLKYERV